MILSFNAWFGLHYDVGAWKLCFSVVVGGFLILWLNNPFGVLMNKEKNDFLQCFCTCARITYLNTGAGRKKSGCFFFTFICPYIFVFFSLFVFEYGEWNA